MSLSLFAALSLSSAAHAAPVADLVTTVTAPAATLVDTDATWTVSVRNTGTKDASAVSLVIALPETNTSPGVYVMGDLGSASSTCTQVGTTLSCNLGLIKKTKVKSVSFTIALPWNAGDLEVVADASTPTSETDFSDNEDSALADVTYPDLVVPAPGTAWVDHCTGTGLTSYFECELFPSSISSHEQDFEVGGTLAFPLYGPEYGGAWWQATDDHLAFTVTELGTVIAEFEGNAVDADCFEGLTTFPGSTYVSPYRVCF
ncbi:DUF11 domain-containing protein [Myxococcota bacterium]|nr:DUF11 domain-containing protein [Myxococcota bacterium]